MCAVQRSLLHAYIFNELQAAGLFLALDSTSTRTDPSICGKKYRKLVNNAVLIRNESLFVVSAVHGYECIPIKTHPAVATQHMPCGLSDTDYRIWEIIIRLTHANVWESMGKPCSL